MRTAIAVAIAFAAIIAGTNAYAIDLNNNGVEGDEAQYIPNPYTGPSTVAELAIFPLASDTWTVSSSPYWWHVGDNVVGTRALGLSSVTHADVHLAIDINVLNGPGFVNLEVRLGGTPVGDFTVLPGMTSIDASFDFAPIAVGAGLQIQYWETNLVAPGAGSIVPNGSGLSTITFDGGTTATEPSTWGEIKNLYR